MGSNADLRQAVLRGRFLYETPGSGTVRLEGDVIYYDPEMPQSDRAAELVRLGVVDSDYDETRCHPPATDTERKFVARISMVARTLMEKVEQEQRRGLPGGKLGVCIGTIGELEEAMLDLGLELDWDSPWSELNAQIPVGDAAE